MQIIRAAVTDRPHAAFVIESLRLRDPGPYEVLVRIEATGLCHSDLNPLEGRSRIPHWPVVLGHEAAGVVEQIGVAVTSVQVGDRIIAAGIRVCGTCWWCLRGQTNLCVAAGSPIEHPLSREDGSAVAAYAGLGTFAEKMLIHEGSAVRIESDLPAEQLALIGCGVTTGICAVTNTARVAPGDSVAVVGVGGVGQSVVQGARLSGASVIVAVDPIALKRESALKLGATHAVDPTAEDAVEVIKGLTGGRGVDHAFEVVGRSESAQQAFESVRRGGALTLVGAASPEVRAPWTLYEQMLHEKRVLGSLIGSAQVRRDFAKVVALVESGQVHLEPMVSRRLGLDEIDDGFAAMHSGEVLRATIVDQSSL